MMKAIIYNASDVLNHRIILNYEAEADGVSSKQIIDSILRKVNITKAK
jgi:MoxR-like ATPase